MNLLHLKYAVEVEKTRSINKAAENLFMSQPNLSRAIKELEESLGIKIFKRTSKGISSTPNGEEFLSYAKKILSQINEVEEMYKNKKNKTKRFSISVPRSSYISYAFSEFINNIDSIEKNEIIYKETNSIRAVNNILSSDFKLGIIRFQSKFHQYFDSMLYEKGITFKTINKFNPSIIMSQNNPLSSNNYLTVSDLNNCIEITYPDPYVPSLPLTDARKAEFSDKISKRIFVFDRGSQFELLNNVKNSFMFSCPMPKNLADFHGLKQIQCNICNKEYEDILIYRDGYHFTDLDNKFIKKLDEVKSLVYK